MGKIHKTRNKSKEKKLYELTEDGKITGVFASKKEAKKAYEKADAKNKLVQLRKKDKKYILECNGLFGITDAGYVYWGKDIQQATLFDSKKQAIRHVEHPSKENVLCYSL